MLTSSPPRPVRLTPSLPAGFSELRPQQEDALRAILETDKKFIIIQAPTGSGKSLIAAMAQRLLNVKALYSPHTKQLQRQFVTDFPSSVELRGRSNYPTTRFARHFPRIHAGLCTSGKEPHCRWCCDGHCGAGEGQKCKAPCAYKEQKQRALRANLAVINNAFFLNEANYVGSFSGWPLVVFDEADLLESILLGFSELSFTAKWIERLRLEPPERKTVQSSWLLWAQEQVLSTIERELRLLQTTIEDIRREEELTRMKRKVEFFLESTQAGQKWAFTATKSSWTFKPGYVSAFAPLYLWRHADRFLLMSATIISLDEMSATLRIPKEDIEFIDLPSTFPAANRSILYWPTANITKATEATERPKAIAALDEVLAVMPPVKTLVHTVSYDYTQQVLKESRFKGRMVSYSGSQQRESVLAAFKASPKPLILVAASMSRGVDLPEDECRLIVLMKTPFANLGDKQVSLRLYSDKKGGRLWYNVNAIREVVQMTGRGVRSDSDRCLSVIVDSQFGRLYEENRFLFPAWWSEALTTVKSRQHLETLVKRWQEAA